MANQPSRSSRRLILLGSTGSIGVNVLAVVEQLRQRELCDFEIAGLATGANAEALHEQARQFGVNHVAIADPARAAALQGIQHVYAGPDAALELVHAVARPGDLLVGAMVGSAGLPATLAAIERGCDIALANKETLVAAGTMVMPQVQQRGINLLPIDSEHSAIYQCLSKRINAETHKRINKKNEAVDTDCVSAFPEFCVSDVRRIVLTASGGPFRTWPKARLENATVEEALNHPTWSMGPKITIDSASLMNKALEIIEAHWLFGMPAQKIDVIIHPQSIVHGLVEFVDGSVIAQMGPPDMRTPIQYALTWPRRVEGCARTMDWASLRTMEFEPVDHERFAGPRLAHRVIRAGGSAGAIFNAANEAAVAAFLERRIPFGRISRLVQDALDAIPPVAVRTLDDVLEADRAARRYVNQALGNKAPQHEGVRV